MGLNFLQKWAEKGAVGRDGGYDVELARAGVRPKTDATSAQTPQPEGQLTVDVCQTAEDIIIESAVAGVRPEDIDVNVTDDSVSIKGSRFREASTTEREYLYQECYWGRFARSIILPETVDPDNADVTFKNGVLTIRLPKANRKKMRKLTVRVD